MEPRIERRRIELARDEELSPEALALLASCGGEIRASDRLLINRAGLDQAHDRRVVDRRGEDRRHAERRGTAVRGERRA